MAVPDLPRSLRHNPHGTNVARQLLAFISTVLNITFKFLPERPSTIGADAFASRKRMKYLAGHPGEAFSENMSTITLHPSEQIVFANKEGL